MSTTRNCLSSVWTATFSFSAAYPGDYGFIPQTTAEDGEAFIAEHADLSVFYLNSKQSECGKGEMWGDINSENPF